MSDNQNWLSIAWHLTNLHMKIELCSATEEETNELARPYACFVIHLFIFNAFYFSSRL